MLRRRGATGPRDKDIICGKSKSCIDHPGSKAFREYIEQYRQSYNAATSKFDKMVITKQIYSNLVNSDHRFLKYNVKEDSWEDVSVMAVRDKIGHALRFASRDKRRDSTASASSATAATEPTTPSDSASSSKRTASVPPLAAHRGKNDDAYAIDDELEVTAKCDYPLRDGRSEFYPSASAPIERQPYRHDHRQTLPPPLALADSNAVNAMTSMPPGIRYTSPILLEPQRKRNKYTPQNEFRNEEQQRNPRARKVKQSNEHDLLLDPLQHYPQSTKMTKVASTAPSSFSEAETRMDGIMNEPVVEWSPESVASPPPRSPQKRTSSETTTSNGLRFFW